MKNMFTRLFASLLAVAMFCCSALSASAEETLSDKGIVQGQEFTLELTSDGVASVCSADDGIMPLSSISGYNQESVNSSDPWITVPTSGSGTGGMGVTFEASSSWNGTMYVQMLGGDDSLPLCDYPVKSKGKTEKGNLRTSNPGHYLFTFSGIPSGVSVFVKIWIYG